MKMRRILEITVLLICFFLLGFSQERNNDKREIRDQKITEEQKSQAKKALSKYDASKLTADDAKAIHRVLRDIGIPKGPAVDEILTSSGFDPELIKKLDPPPDKRSDNNKKDIKEPNQKPKKDNDSKGNKYSIEQAISDKAQLSTIAFSGLAFLSGNFGAATFIPPGKVCDFFGFQYMRDIDIAGKGHNPMFLNRVVGNVFYILNTEQKKMFLDLAEEQAPQFEALALMRLPLIKAFYMEKDNQIPNGSSGLNKESVMKSVGEIFKFDAKLSYRRAEVMARVALSLTAEQKAYFSKMKFGDFNSWPEKDERDKGNDIGRDKSKMFKVAYMTYASEFFSWIQGSEEADTYFCPERHGTYFGGFYMKDMPAMGKRNYDISTSITGDNGNTFLNEALTPEQRKNIEELPALQINDMKEIILIRKSISKELRKFLSGNRPDENIVIELGKRYGELDGEVSWYYAKAFAKVSRTLSEKQKTELLKLRNLSGYESAPYYIYSEAMRNRPEFTNVESLFFTPKK